MIPMNHESRLMTWEHAPFFFTSAGSSCCWRGTPTTPGNITSDPLQQTREARGCGGERRGCGAHQAFKERGVEDAELVRTGNQKPKLEKNKNFVSPLVLSGTR